MRVIVLSVFLVSSIIGISQKYYMPDEILEAYKKGTRDLRGMPGSDYFQNSAHYSIKASFDPVKGILQGTSKIKYVNNSPDSLYFIVIRLYHDIMRKGNIRDEEVGAEDIGKGVQIHSLVIDNIEYINNPDVFINRSGTNLLAVLPEYLVPNGNVMLSIRWTTQLPGKHLHRFGHYGQDNWFVAYWYPQIAVYDDVDGWDQINYTGTYEFYNDFASFDVEVSVPKGHIVWATGDWENPESVLSERKLEKYNQAQASDQQISIIGRDDWDNNSVFKKSGKLKYHFLADNVTDFAFAVSGNYLWDAASVITDSVAGARTVVHTAYPVDATGFDNLAAYAVRAVKHFSGTSLGIPYPFPKATIFNGDGGMEFPMMVNQREESLESNNFVAMHELFHAYFPFMTGLNEKKYAWMDEGLTSYLPMETESFLGGYYFTMPKVNQNYNFFAGRYDEAPLMWPSYELRDFSYQHQAYFRSSVALFILEQYLGRAKFRGAIREFALRWSGKHPTGYDFIFTLEDYCHEDLGWLIRPLFFERAWADIAISNARIKDNILTVELINQGGFPLPVDIRVIQDDGQVHTEHLGVEVWKKGQKSILYNITGIKDFKKVEIGNPDLPDKDTSNNFLYPTKDGIKNAS